MARAALNLSAQDLATVSGVGYATIARFESGANLRDNTLQRLRDALEEAGVEFIPENGGGAGVRLKSKV